MKKLCRRRDVFLSVAQLEVNPLKFVRQLLTLLAAALLLVAVLALPATATTVHAERTQSPIFVNGTRRQFEAYFIDGNNYFQIRDLAYALRSTDKQFQVDYNAQTKQIDLTSQAAYTAIGGEMSTTGSLIRVDAAPTASAFYLNGKSIKLTAYLINGTNFVKLRDLAAAIDFGVTYTAASRTINIDTSVGYTPDKTAATSANDLNVTLIGDSIGINLATYLDNYYPNLYVDAEVSRQFSAAQAIVETLLQNGKLGPVVVIELGANGEIRESQLRTLIELIGSNRKIVFVNVQVPRSWCADDNATLTKVCAEYPNTIIADWFSASINNSDYFYKDGVHPNSTGCAVMAKIVAAAIAEIMAI